MRGGVVKASLRLTAKCELSLLQFSDKAADPVDGLFIEKAGSDFAVVLNFLVDLDALFAHEEPALLGGSLQHSQSSITAGDHAMMGVNEAPRRSVPRQPVQKQVPAPHR